MINCGDSVRPRYMCSPQASFGKPPRLNYVLQLEEAIAEWQRRNGNGATETDPGRSRRQV
jgi:hypothetical protein